ncbi:MAG: hypothetical protein WD770_07040 [Actinomycetota bacterium]
MSSGPRWGRRRGRRSDEDYLAEAHEEEPDEEQDLGFSERAARAAEREAQRPQPPPPQRRVTPGGRGGLGDLFDNDRETDSRVLDPDPEADALEARLVGEPPGPSMPEPPLPANPADQARDELAALLAQAEAQAEPVAAGPAIDADLRIEPDLDAPTAMRQPAERRPLESPAEPALEEMAEPAGRPGTTESWDAIESLFTRRPDQGEPSGEEDAGLRLEWERPEMFTEPTQEEILRRITELAQGLELVEQRLEDLAKPLGELTEPGTRLAAAFKRLELIERGFEEMRLTSERNTLKTGSALNALDSSMGELRASMEEPMWEMSERLTSAEIRLTELQAAERLIEQVNTALSKDPFDLVSTRDIDEITDNITTKVKRLGGRVERLEAALDRGLSGLEEARRAALGAARELNKAVERATRDLPKARSSAASGGAKKAAATRKPAARKAAAKSAARKSAAKRR